MENAFYQPFCDLAVSPLQNPNRKLLVRPRKRPKKKGAAQTPRGLLFRELSLWWERKLLPCERLEIHEAQVMDGTARKSPFPSHQTGGGETRERAFLRMQNPDMDLTGIRKIRGKVKEAMRG